MRLALILAAGLLVTSAFAAESESTRQSGQSYGYAPQNCNSFRDECLNQAGESGTRGENGIRACQSYRQSNCRLNPQ